MIRNAFQNGGFQDGKYRILNAFDMLNIQRGINVYARLQQLLYVLIAFPVAGIVRISVGELINQNELRPPFQTGVQAHIIV